MKVSVKTVTEKATRRLRVIQKQTPYAASRALNSTIDKVRSSEMTEVVKKINKPTPQTVEAYYTRRSNKRRLVASIHLKKYAEYLKGQILGGHESKPKPVPGQKANVNTYGNLPRRATKGAKVFYRKTKRGDGAYWKVTGGKRNPKLHMVGLIPSGGRDYKPRLDFYGVAERTARRHFNRYLNRYMAIAIRSAR